MNPALFDILAIAIEKPNTVRFMDQGKTHENAEAIEKFAIMRRGVDTEFYAVVPANTYEEGELWKGKP